jgi:hypothetical protein
MTNQISLDKALSVSNRNFRNSPKNKAFAQKLQNKMKHSEKFAELTNPKKENGTDIAYKQTAAEFEIAFESFMYNLQFNTIDVDPLMGGGIGEEVFRSQLVDAMIRERRKDNPGNIAKQIYEKIKKDDTSNNHKRGIPKIHDE